MAFGALRSLSRALNRVGSTPGLIRVGLTPGPPPPLRVLASAFHILTDTHFPKRRPSLTSRRKRASYNPPGPYRWVRPIPAALKVDTKTPNQGSVKRRNEKKRIIQRKAFIMSEKKKRIALVQEANRKKLAKRVERKMAAVARERAWQERLKELQRLDEEKKNKATIA